MHLAYKLIEFLVLKRYLRWSEEDHAASLAARMFSPVA